jgi:Zn-dependent metalloprotease
MKKILITLFVFCVGIMTLSAQENGNFTNFVNPFQTKSMTETPPTVIRPQQSKPYSVTKNNSSYFVKFPVKPSSKEAMETMKQVFELRQADALQFKGEYQDDLGLIHRRYQQYFQGLEVFGSQMLTHEKNGFIQTINGHFYANLQVNVTPSLSEQSAIAKAMQYIGAEQWQWQSGNETYYNQLTGGSLQPTAMLMLAPTNGNFTPDAYRLVYKVNINAQKPYGVYDVFVDAKTGGIVMKVDKIATGDAIGTAQTLYSGTQTITTDNTGSNFRLRESGRNIQTKNMNNGTNFNNAVDFTNTTNTWTPSGVSLSSVIISGINNNWYTNFSENPANGGLPDLFIIVLDAGNNNIYQSATTWNQMPPVTISNINLNLAAGQTYTVQIWDNDNSIFTHDLLGSFTATGAGTGSSNFNNAGNSGSYTKGNATPDPALDAHWGMEKTYDFYLNKLSRNSFDGNGAAIKNFVHYDNAMENAFWDPNLQALVFGDGASTFGPLTSIDVAGHEFSHAVVTSTADLVYQGESGALNESFADIFGTAIEFYAKPATADWEIGSEITLVAPGHLRSMSNPNDGLSPQPDTYGGTHWADPSNTSVDNGGVHINSGVQNYWYYLLANGGSGTNDLGNSFSVTGIGIDNATAIAYRNLSVYLNQNSNHNDALIGSVQAAQDLFGTNSAQVTAVQNAWYAVGLGSGSGGGSGSAFCSGNTVLNAASDVFSDGSGSADYQDNADCSWLIQPIGASQVTLTFTSFNTELNYDSVKVYDGVNANAALLLAWTGSTTPPNAITSTTGALFVRFTSDGSQTDAGWEASYTSSGTAFCNGGQTLTTQTGTFSDGSGASNYANNAFCYWKIAPAGANDITLNFTTFDTESGYDGVIVYDGESVNDPILLDWTGTTLPPATTSTGDKMLIVFTSDATVTQSGFEANYTISGGNTFCSTAIVTEDFTTIEDGSGNSNYYDNTSCSWLIQPANAEAIDFYFTFFDLEAATADGTVYDAVELYDGSDDSAPLLGRFSGSSVPPVITSTGGSMFIKFYSDASVNYAGWEGYFVTKTASYCQGNTVLNNASGTVTDGSGANDYGNGSECSWSLQAQAGSYVLLTFTAFQTEANFDFVIVYDGVDDSAPIMGSYSGSTIPNQLISSAEDMYVVFVSDESVVEGGFSANYNTYLVNTKDLTKQYDLAVFPNPFTNQLTVQFDLESSEDVTVQLIDIVGRTLYQENLGKRTSGKNQYFINTEDLAKGAYILKLQIGDKVINQKVLKMK